MDMKKFFKEFFGTSVQEGDGSPSNPIVMTLGFNGNFMIVSFCVWLKRTVTARLHFKSLGLDHDGQDKEGIYMIRPLDAAESVYRELTGNGRFHIEMNMYLMSRRLVLKGDSVGFRLAGENFLILKEN